MKRKPILLMSMLACVMALSSCLGSDEPDNPEYKEANEAFFAEQMALLGDDGKKFYEVINPVFAPSIDVLVRWHNDRSLTAKEFSPLDNSTCDFTYALYDYEGTEVQTSFASTTYGDSIYRAKPCEMIVGVWAALVNMHVGDTCTVVIPYQGGYGPYTSGSLEPYSTLVYQLKLKGVPGLEIDVN